MILANVWVSAINIALWVCLGMLGLIVLMIVLYFAAKTITLGVLMAKEQFRERMHREHIRTTQELDQESEQEPRIHDASKQQT